MLFRSLVDSFDGVSTAVKYARSRMVEYEERSCRPSSYDPGTTVYLLVEQLKKYLDV